MKWLACRRKGHEGGNQHPHTLSLWAKRMETREAKRDNGYNNIIVTFRLFFGWSAVDWSWPVKNKSISSKRKGNSLVFWCGRKSVSCWERWLVFCWERNTPVQTLLASLCTKVSFAPPPPHWRAGSVEKCEGMSLSTVCLWFVSARACTGLKASGNLCGA